MRYRTAPRPEFLLAATQYTHRWPVISSFERISSCGQRLFNAILPVKLQPEALARRSSCMEQDKAKLAALRRHWMSLMGVMALMVAAFTVLTDYRDGAWVLPSAAWFYINAALNLAGVVAAFLLRERHRRLLPYARSPEEALRLVQLMYLVSLMPLYTASLFAGIATYAGGETINLLFTLPFFAFGLIFFPSEANLQAHLQASRFNHSMQAEPPNQEKRRLP
jgi:hypothetical protein